MNCHAFVVAFAAFVRSFSTFSKTASVRTMANACLLLPDSNKTALHHSSFCSSCYSIVVQAHREREPFTKVACPSTYCITLVYVDRLLRTLDLCCLAVSLLATEYSTLLDHGDRPL